jgi:hypothetical protein
MKRTIAGILRGIAPVPALYALVFGLVGGYSLSAQQLPQVSQFLSQKYMMNPAVAVMLIPAARMRSIWSTSGRATPYT